MIANEVAPASGRPRLLSQPAGPADSGDHLGSGGCPRLSCPGRGLHRRAEFARPALGAAQGLNDRMERVDHGLVARAGFAEVDHRSLGNLGRPTQEPKVARGGRSIRLGLGRHRGQRSRVERSDRAADGAHGTCNKAKQVGGGCFGRSRLEPAADVRRPDAHGHPVIAITGGSIEPPELLPRPVQGVGGGQDRGLQGVTHRWNLAARAGSSNRSLSSSSSRVTLIEAPAISSDVMNSPTMLRRTLLPARSSARRAAR